MYQNVNNLIDHPFVMLLSFGLPPPIPPCKKIQDHKFAKLPLSSSLSPGNPVGKFKTKPVTEFRLLICHPASLQFSKQIQIHEYTYLETSKANRTAFGHCPYN